MPVLQPITFDPPQVALPVGGLYAVVNWDTSAVPRFLDAGVDFRPHNTKLEGQVGRWTDDWLVTAAGTTGNKFSNRTTAFPDTFTDWVIYSFDHNYNADLTVESRDEVKARALHALALLEPIRSETIFADRLKTDTIAPPAKSGLTATVGYLESEAAKLGLTGFIHASAQWAAYARERRLDTNGVSPLGHRWVYGGGYVAGLDNELVLTTQPFGWRSPAVVNDSIWHNKNQYVAVAERAVLIGYEAVIAAATVS
jgi:hypothetical protein